MFLKMTEKSEWSDDHKSGQLEKSETFAAKMCFKCEKDLYNKSETNWMFLRSASSIEKSETTIKCTRSLWK